MEKTHAIAQVLIRCMSSWQ